MAFLFRKADEGFERLQSLMLSLRSGDAVSVSDAVRISGLTEHFCRAALEALTQVGLLVRETDSRFVRRTLDSDRQVGVSSRQAS